MNQEGFLKKYNISDEDFKKTKLNWKQLEIIQADYIKHIPKLESSAIYIFNSLMKTPNVHSVRYRIKDAEHVIEKIIRKKIKEPKSNITLDNYIDELTDLIGVRALHLFKEDWFGIHELITSTWDFKEEPVANYREGDSLEYKKKFEELGCNVKEHPFGYRSVHYIVETKPAKAKYYAEIQVRTIFEEAWSEIDHTIRYPYDQDNPIFGQFLMILNRLAGSADEMGTFIQFLKKDLQQRENVHKQALIEKDDLIKQLEAKVKDLKIGQPDLQFLTDGLEKLKMPILNFKSYTMPDLSFLESMTSIQMPDYSGILSKMKAVDYSSFDSIKPIDIKKLPK